MLGPPLVLGAVLLGIGAVVNGACFVGSLWRLGNGDVHLFGLPVGIVCGDVLGRMLGWRAAVPPSRFAHPDGAGLLLVTTGALLLVLAWRWLQRQGPEAARLAATMAAMGAAGSLLFVVLPEWSWVDVVNSRARALVAGDVTGGAGGPSAGLRAALATLAGAVASGWMMGQLHLRWQGWAAAARSIAGGVLMMLGVGLIPGGNDALLLGAAPAGAISAVVAFVIMNLTILVLAAAPLARAAPPARH
jgi:hypothetical protein